MFVRNDLRYLHRSFAPLGRFKFRLIIRYPAAAHRRVRSSSTVFNSRYEQQCCVVVRDVWLHRSRRRHFARGRRRRRRRKLADNFLSFEQITTTLAACSPHATRRANVDKPSDKLFVNTRPLIRQISHAPGAANRI